MFATPPPKGMRTTVRTPGTLVRDLSRAVQESLDVALARAPKGSVLHRALRFAARSWATVWLIGVTALAACVAWVGALYLGLGSPVPAAAGAIITVALWLNRSLRCGLSLVGATAAALIVGFALYPW